MSSAGRKNFSNLSNHTLYEFLRTNQASSHSANPIHRRPWIAPIRRQEPPVQPTTQLTALQRLAAERSDEVVKPKPLKRKFIPLVHIDDRKSVSVPDTQLKKENDPPPMFENPAKNRRGTRLNHIKGSSPQQLSKLRGGLGGKGSERQVMSVAPKKLPSIDDLHRSILVVDFSNLESSLEVEIPEQIERDQIHYDSLESYVERQSQVLLVETMEGFSQSLASGYISNNGGNTKVSSSLFFSTVNVRVTMAVRRGREFCHLTLKREDSDESSELTQGDVVIMLRPQSKILENILKYGFRSRQSPNLLDEKGAVMIGVCERTKTPLVVSKGSKSIQLKCCFASKDRPLGYSPSDCSVGSEWVAVVVHSLLTVEREWKGLCAFGTSRFLRNPNLVETVLGYETGNPTKKLARRESLATMIDGFKNLNVYQREAVEVAADISRQDNGVVLLQGPPGTGKTHTLTILLRLLYNRGFKKILVSAPSNAAIDELMARMIAFLPNQGRGTVLRVGRNSRPELRPYALDSLVSESQSKSEEARHAQYKEKKSKLISDITRINDEINLPTTSSLRKSELIRAKERVRETLENLKSREEESVKCQRDTIYKKFLSEAQFICGTLSSFGSEPVWNNLPPGVDFCIVDEAAQCIEVSSIIPLKFDPQRLVLVGDPQQLPAVVKSVVAKRMRFDMSLIERLQLLGHKTYMLKEQYRMHECIASFPSKFFYDNQLLTAESILGRKSEHPVPITFIDVDGHNDIRSGTSIINPRQGRIVADYVRKILDTSRSSVGVIAPYKHQVNLIRNLLSSSIGGDRLEIDSVDAFQGREKDVIIFDCVRAGGIEGDGVGFLSDSRRLNVAITRAKHALVIVGNAKFLAEHGGPVWASFIEFLAAESHIERL